MTKGRIITVLIFLMMVSVLILTACSNQSSAASNNSKIKATWIKPEVTDDSVLVPVSVVDKDIITHFKLSSPTGELAFMVYTYDGKLYARANICPPCLSEGFSLKSGTLVCDTCGTVFDAKTGAGIRGACVAYPKASAAYVVDKGNIVIKKADLVTAFQNTIKPQ